MISKDFVSRWSGKDVFDPTGEKIGTVADFYLDKDTYDPDWVIVKKGFLGARDKLVPFIAVEWNDDHAVVCYEKEMVDDSPGPGIDGRLSDEEELGLMDHYHLVRSHSGMVGTMGHRAPDDRRREYAVPDDRRSVGERFAEHEPAPPRRTMDESERRRLADQAAAAHPFSADLEEEDGLRGEGPAGERAKASTSAPMPAPAASADEFAGEQVAGSTRLVRVKKYVVTERVEQTPVSEEEFEEGIGTDEERGTGRRAA